MKHVLNTVTEDGDASDDEDDLEVGGVTQDYKCPISLTTLVNPMTSYVTSMACMRRFLNNASSKVCGHSFSGAVIQDYLKKAGKDGISCPAAGCTKRLTMAALKHDKDLEKKVRIAERNRQRQEEDSDDAEVIE